MWVIIAYLAVILIWSTTPLAIVWSSESVSPVLALLLRIAVGALLAIPVIMLTKTRIKWDRTSLVVYAYSSFGMLVGMLLVYQASRYISSGLISLIFGLAPIISGILGHYLLPEQSLSKQQVFGILLAFAGLTLVSFDNLAIGPHSMLGILLVLCSTFIFSFTSVQIKRIGSSMTPLAITSGTLWLTLPIFVVIWLISDGHWPTAGWTDKAIAAIVYLGLFGSLLGMLAYYYVLNKLNPTTVTMTTMITPVFAILIGSYFNDEAVSLLMIKGGLLVLTGLLLFVFEKIRR